MKILHVVQGIEPKLGGLPVAMFNIIELEQKLGYESSILTIGESVNYSFRSNVNYHIFPASFPKRFSRSNLAIDWLSKHIIEYDLLVIHGIWTFLCIETSYVAITKKIKYIIWPHGSLDPFDLQKKRWLKVVLGPLVIKKSLNHAKKICLTSKQEAILVETYGSKVTRDVLALPVPNTVYSVNKTSFRNKYNFKESDFVILFLGRVNYKKNIETILSIIPALQEKFPEVKLAIAGSDVDNSYADKLKKMVKDLSINHLVTFCGEVTGKDKSNAFYGSDCFVLPSYNENFGLAVIESLQHGTPVIISKNIYIWKEIVSLQGGWACEPTQQDLFHVLESVLSNQAGYSQIKSSCKKAADHFSADNLLNTYKIFYEGLMKFNIDKPSLN